jgi:polysaccharide export outer membrane protein
MKRKLEVMISRAGMVAVSVATVAAMLATPAAAEQAPGAGYRIGPKDLIEVRVFEVPELNIERRVTDDGMLNLPLLGDVPASGMTPEALGSYLKTVLESRYVQRASVAVQVKEYRSRPIAIMGAVKQPGNLAFSGRWTLIEVLAAVGGLTDGHGNTIYVLRHADNGLSDQLAISAEDLLVRADPDANIPIFANDVINVPPAAAVTIFCLGEVRQPGALTFLSTERITVLTAVARAGGLTDRASSKILVKRRGADGRDTETVFNYKRIVAGKDPDAALKPGDVVVVKESLF